MLEKLTAEIQGQATYGMANLRQKTTGLPFIVFISQRDGARHDVRVKVSPEPRVRLDQLSSYSVRPFEHKEGPALTAQESRLLNQWMTLNEQVLVDYWNGELAFTEDAIDRLRPI